MLWRRDPPAVSVGLTTELQRRDPAECPRTASRRSLRREEEVTVEWTETLSLRALVFVVSLSSLPSLRYGGECLRRSPTGADVPPPDGIVPLGLGHGERPHSEPAGGAVGVSVAPPYVRAAKRLDKTGPGAAGSSGVRLWLPRTTTSTQEVPLTGAGVGVEQDEGRGQVRGSHTAVSSSAAFIKEICCDCFCAMSIK